MNGVLHFCEAIPASLHGDGQFVLRRKDYIPAYVRAFEEGLLQRLVEQALESLRSCRVCPRDCQIERLSNSIGVCKSQVYNAVGFGEIADFVWGDQKLMTTAKGSLSYSWADDQGNIYQATEPFKVDISLAVIEVPSELAECGDGFGGSNRSRTTGSKPW